MKINSELGRLGVILAFLSVIFAPLMIYSEYGIEGIEVASVIITGLLTLSLVVLYFQQYTILEKQTQLQHREYQSSLTKIGTIVADDDTLTFKLKNKGRGKIKHIFLKSEIISGTSELDISFGRVKLKDKKSGSTELSSDSEVREFEGKPNFRVLNWNNPDRHYTFKFISSRLSRQEINSCTIQLTLEVVDESILEGQFSQEIEIAKQEIQLEGKQQKEITNQHGEKEKREYITSTTIEEGLDSDYSSNNDINRFSEQKLEEYFDSIHMT